MVHEWELVVLLHPNVMDVAVVDEEVLISSATTVRWSSSSSLWFGQEKEVPMKAVMVLGWVVGAMEAWMRGRRKNEMCGEVEGGGLKVGLTIDSHF